MSLTTCFDGLKLAMLPLNSNVGVFHSDGLGDLRVCSDTDAPCAPQHSIMGWSVLERPVNGRVAVHLEGNVEGPFYARRGTPQDVRRSATAGRLTCVIPAACARWRGNNVVNESPNVQVAH